MFFTNCIGSCCLKERKLLVVGWVFEKIMSRLFFFFLSSGYNCDGEPIHFFIFFLSEAHLSIIRLPRLKRITIAAATCLST